MDDTTTTASLAPSPAPVSPAPSEPIPASADAPAPALPPPDGGKKKRSLSNLLLRALSAILVLAVIYLCLRWDVTHGQGWAWAALLSVFSILGMREFYRFARNCDMRPFTWFGYVMGPLFILAQEWELSGASSRLVSWSPSIVAGLLGIVGPMLLQLTRDNNDTSIADVGSTILGFLYCALPALSVHLRHLSFGGDGWPMQGVEFALVCIFISKVSDVGALLTGSKWGKRKLIPRLSPGKTVEGAIGGWLFAVFLLLFMVITFPYLTGTDMALRRVGWLWLIALSTLLAAGGLAGDLIESSFKRNSKRKDAGRGVPGFGGVLDLTDSLMVATPVMYFFLVFFGAEYVQS